MDINTMVDNIRSAKNFDDARRILEGYLDTEYTLGYNIGYDDGWDDRGDNINRDYGYW